MLKKVRHLKLYDEVASQIEESILAGDFNPGDKLPSERQLEEILGASRGTIRQSLRMLEQKGVLEIKTGIQGGAFIREVTPDLIANSIPLLIKHNYVTPEHIANFREEIEGGVIARLAVQNMEEADIAELKKMLERLMALDSYKELDWDEFDRQEADMHVFLGKITRNPLYEALSAIIMKSVQHHTQIIGRVKDVSGKVIEEWSEIIESLEAKNEKKATRLIVNHIHAWIKYNQ